MSKILIVDDEVDTVRILKMLLEQENYEVLTAVHGRQGLDMALAERPDLIILDVLMPVMDGYTLYKELQKDPVTKNIPVIILTARGAMEDSFEAVGADRFMEKPVETPELMSAISALIEHAQKSGRKRTRQRVLLAGTYPEVLDVMEAYISTLGHDVIKVHTAADVLRKSVEFHEGVLILEVQLDGGVCSAQVIKAIRLLPEMKDVPILLYSYYRVSELGSSDFRRRVLNIEKAVDECIAAGATAYFDRYNEELFKEQIVKYL